MNLTDEEIEKLKGSKSEAEWNRVCDEIQKSRNGSYPLDWWPRMMLSGLIADIQANWY